VVRNPKPTHQFETIPVVTMVPESTPTPEEIKIETNGESETSNNE
jgi:hypothetical protein